MHFPRLSISQAAALAFLLIAAVAHADEAAENDQHQAACKAEFRVVYRQIGRHPAKSTYVAKREALPDSGCTQTEAKVARTSKAPTRPVR